MAPKLSCCFRCLLHPVHSHFIDRPIHGEGDDSSVRPCLSYCFVFLRNLRFEWLVSVRTAMAADTTIMPAQRKKACSGPDSASAGFNAGCGVSQVKIARVFPCILMLLLPACGEREPMKTLRPPTPTLRDRWPEITPELAGMDRARLDEVAAAVQGNGVIIRHDAIAYQWGKPGKALDIASASKAIYSFLVMRAVQNGIIPSLDQPVVKWLPELAGLNAALGHKDRRITWRHLINQTSCYGVTEEPGAAFDYNDYQTGLLWKLMFEKVYKSPGAESIRVLEEQLFKLIDAEGKSTMREMNTNDQVFRLTISPLDMARFGSVFLHGGKWKDRQIIDPEFVDLVLHHPLPLDLPRTKGEPAEMLPDAPSYGGGSNQDDHLGSYSHMWWLNRRGKDGDLLFPSAPDDAFAAIGYGGEKVLMVVPSLDLIISWNTDQLTRAPMVGMGRQQMNEVLQILFASIK